MNIEIVILATIIGSMFIVLIKEWLVPELTVFLALSAIILFGILTPEEALKGFANPGVHTVGLLFIIAAAVSKTGLLDELIEKFLTKQMSLQGILFYLMLPVSTLSAFINNTPIVTMLIPSLQNWGITNNIKPSKLLIPLSYAAILGGTITLIGTSTNLIIHGLIIDKGLKGFHFFEFIYFGIPLTLIGIFYFVLVGHRLLPNRNHNIESFEDEKNNYIFRFYVEKTSPLIGRTIKEALLRDLHDIFLFQIMRKEKMIIPASKDEVIREEDVLFFSGSTDGILKIGKNTGLRLCTENKHEKVLTSKHASLYEVVISSNSPLIYKKIKDVNFRSKYNAAIVSVKRKNKQMISGIGNIPLQPGDTLLLLAKQDFIHSWKDSDDFFLISPVHQPQNQIKWKNSLILAILVGVILSSSFQFLSIYKLSLIATVIFFIANIVNVSDAKRAINWNILILMASSIGIGAAVEKTGLAAFIASFLINIQNSLGLIGILVVYYLVTLIMTELLNNLATAALMFPIGYSIALQLSLDPVMFAMITAIAASCSFLTPIGYQTNLLVYGPGGYKFTDYIKVGLPLSLICMAITILIASIKWL
jgi:di/tricarboxylate transporter